VERSHRRDVRLGSNLTAGERPQAVVPAHAWQQAQSLGTWTLVGCTVAPGFEFAGFELAPVGSILSPSDDRATHSRFAWRAGHRRSTPWCA
jgi:predicted cupin superfamily sugar epimerase